MGDKRVSKRTLDSGETVLHHPPSEEYPNGKQVLLPQGSPLRDRLDSRLVENQARHDEMQQALLDNIEIKKAAQEEKGLPPEKSAL